MAVIRPLAFLMTDLCYSSWDGGGGRTRTYEGVSQRIYRFPPPIDLIEEMPSMSRLCRILVRT